MDLNLYEYFNRGYVLGPRTISTPQKFNRIPHLDDMVDLFDCAVIKCITDDFGVMFSGGMDSSMIVASLMKQGISPTCFIGADFDGPLAVEFCLERNLDFCVIQPTPLEETGRLTKGGLPMQFISALSVDSVCKTASKIGIKTLISGEGGDEIFWGYPRYANIIKASGSKPEHIYYGSGINNREIVEELTASHKKGQCFDWILDNLNLPEYALISMFDQVWRSPQLQYRNSRFGHGIDFKYPFMDLDFAQYVNETDPVFKCDVRETKRPLQRELYAKYLYGEPKKKQPWSNKYESWFSSKTCRAEINNMKFEGLDKTTIEHITKTSMYPVLCQKLWMLWKSL